MKKFKFSCCLQRSVALVFIAALLSTVLLAILISINNRNANSTELLVNNTHSMSRQAEHIRSAIAANGPAFQSWLLSGDDERLDNLHNNQQQMTQLITQLKSRATEPEQQQKLQRLQQLANEKIRLQQTKTDVAETRDRRLGISMQSILNDFLQRQDELLDQRTEASSYARNKSNTSIIAGALLLFLFITGSLIRLNKDIRLRKLAQEEIKSSEAKYRRLIEDAGVTLFTCDTSGTFTYVNERCLPLTGFHPKELMGQNFSMLLLPSWIAQLTAVYVQQARDKSPELTIEFPILTKDASIKWVEQHSVIIYNEYHEPNGYHCVVKDITQRKKLEDPTQTQLNGYDREMRLKAC
ncbi:MAG TPA: PAS domain S-box protein [Chitinophagaceae bacterium]